VFGLLSSIDKPLLPIMMKSTFSILATFTMPSGVDPITSVERTLTPCFLPLELFFLTLIRWPF
jgi:hypothetical protein